MPLTSTGYQLRQRPDPRPRPRPQGHGFVAEVAVAVRVDRNAGHRPRFRAGRTPSESPAPLGRGAHHRGGGDGGRFCREHGGTGRRGVLPAFGELEGLQLRLEPQKGVDAFHLTRADGAWGEGVGMTCMAVVVRP